MTRQRKYLLIIGAVLFLIVLADRILPNFKGFQFSDDEITLKEKKLAKYRQFLQEKESVRRNLIRLNREAKRAEAGFLTGKTPALAAADIQNILNRIAEKSKIVIGSMRVLKPEEPDKTSPEKNHFIAVPVQITIISSIRQLKEFLYAVETSQKLLKVSDMNMRVPNLRQPGNIYVNLTVSGIMMESEK